MPVKHKGKGRKYPKYKRMAKRGANRSRTVAGPAKALAERFGRSSGMSYGMANIARNLISKNQALPSSLWCEFTYVDEGQLASQSLLNIFGSTKTFKLNSMFAPGGQTNHQPYQWDQLTNAAGGPYDEYQVYSVAFEIQFMNPTAAPFAGGAFVGALITCNGDGYGIGTNSLYEVVEKPGGWGEYFPTVSTKPLILKGSVNMWSLSGQSKAEWEADPFNRAIPSANPSNSPGLQIAYGDLGAPLTPSTCQYVAKFVYKCKLMQRNTQVKS